MIGVAVSAPAVFRTVGSLDGIVDAKASKIKRLRTDSDEATISLAVFFVWRTISFAHALQEK